MALTAYQKKRDFGKTPEPGPEAEVTDKGDLFVVQKHDASRLHYDFRLELDGVLKSWAVPKGPSLDPENKRLAVATEDHPLAYGDFEGTIPKDEYGGGTVMLWDRGRWTPKGDPEKGLRKGKLSFELDGEKLHGSWALIQLKSSDDPKNWLLIKEQDDVAQDDDDWLEDNSRSIVSGRSMDEIAAAPGRVWQDGEAKKSPAAALDPSEFSGAKKKKQASSMKPQLATLAEEVPEGDDWIHEIKLDGYRFLAFIVDGKVRLLTRNGKDWSEKFTPIVQELSHLPIEQGVLDGEVVALEPDGRSNFQALQRAIKFGGDLPLVFYVFDLLFLGGYDLRSTPLLERKSALRDLFPADENAGRVRWLDHLEGNGPAFHEQACETGLEGIICKRRDAPYRNKRSRHWLKVKCMHRQEFVIAGYTDPEGSRTGFGSLLLGVQEDDGLVYCGRVGTGFSDDMLEELHGRFQELSRKTCPFEKEPKGISLTAHWITPKLLCEVQFTEWTADGHLRHPAFKGLREDKSPAQVKRETPQPPPDQSNSTRSKDTMDIAGVTLTNPDRILYPEQGVTKQALAEYYAGIADYVMPHLEKRPISLVRCPSGVSGQCFYQRHVGDTLPAPVRSIAIDGKEKEYIAIDDLAGLITLVQFGALEIHPWGCREDRPDRPDRLIFDLDPDPGVDWAEIVDAAHEVHDVLAGLGLESFARLSGGKGLHLVVPLTRRHDWDEAKAFSKAIATLLARDKPDVYTANMSKKKRQGKIYVDFQRNSRTATAVASYSTRARSGAPVAVPLRWDEVTADRAPDSYDIHAVSRRLGALDSDPWDGFFSIRQSITNEMKQTLGMSD